jgi:hypothetical protein
VTLAGAGRIAPLGSTTVTGSIRFDRGNAHGTLAFETPKASAILRVSGPSPSVSPAAATTTTLAFALSGRTVVPNTLFSYVPEQGWGSVTLTLTPAAGRRAGLTMQFHSL